MAVTSDSIEPPARLNSRSTSNLSVLDGLTWSTLWVWRLIVRSRLPEEFSSVSLPENMVTPEQANPRDKEDPSEHLSMKLRFLLL